MDTRRVCERCGRPLDQRAVQGLCPECLINAGLESGTTAGAGSERKPQGKSSGFIPPSPEELAPHFPQLEILELIGAGGMGAVYKAVQKALDRPVALKILPPEVGAEPSFSDRFAREARALARLSHPHIVTVHESGKAGGFYYFVMEFVDGLNLRELLAAQRLMPAEALRIVPQICEALQYAHDRGVVHRDIKPENVLMDRLGIVKIADFGLAKIIVRNPAEARLTGEGQVMGTPHYMAPEQVEHPREVDHRADIYSLGVVFYEMLTGELPLGKFAPPSRKVHMDVRLDDVVLQALEKEPERRYQHASQVKTAVETIASTPAPVTTPPPPSLPSPPPAPGGEPGLGQPRLSRLAIAGAIWAPLFLVGLFGMISVRSVSPAEASHGPTVWQVLAMILTVLVSFTAPLGTTILGCLGIGEIRRSRGRIYGMGLALFDGLIYPVLALDGLIGWMVFTVGELLVRPGQPFPRSLGMVITLLLCGVVDVLVVRWAWRAAHKPLAGTPPPLTGPAAPSGGPPPNLPPGRSAPATLPQTPGIGPGTASSRTGRWREVLVDLGTLHLAPAIILLLLLVVVVPGFLMRARFYGIALPPATQITVQLYQLFSAFWFVLIPLLLGVDLGIAYLLQEFVSRRARRAWSVLVGAALALSICFVGISLWIVPGVETRLTRQVAAGAVAPAPLGEGLSTGVTNLEVYEVPGEVRSVESGVSYLVASEAPPGIRGRVLGADGTPLTGAKVALCTRQNAVVILNGALEKPRVAADTGADGAFTLPAASEYNLLAVHADGFAWVTAEQFATNQTVQLAPWGSVQGEVFIGSKPARNRQVDLQTGRTFSVWDQRVRFTYSARTDGAGRFTMNRVPPGWFDIGYQTQVGGTYFNAASWAPAYSITSRRSIEIRPGETTVVRIGGEGRPVIGRFVAPPGVSFDSGMHYMTSPEPTPPRPPNEQQMTAEQRRAFEQQWRALAEGRKAIEDAWHSPSYRRFAFRIQDDGRFRIDDVPAGSYTLSMSVEKPFSKEDGSQVSWAAGGYQADIVVPEMRGGRSDQPLDLGELTVSMFVPGQAMQGSGLEFRFVAEPRSSLPCDPLRDPNDRTGTNLLRVEKVVQLNGSAVQRAAFTHSAGGTAEIELEFTPAGAQRLAEVTRANLRRRLAILFNGQVLCAPAINTELGSQARITGMMTEPEVRRIVDAINAAAQTNSARASGGDAETVSPAPLRFICVVTDITADPIRLSLDGRRTTWEELPGLLAQQTDRRHTVLQFAVTTQNAPLDRYNDARSRLTRLCQQFGFAHLSEVGVRPLDFKGNGAPGQR